MNPPPRLTESGFNHWIDRVIAMVCLACLIPALGMASHQLEVLQSWWLVLLGGGLIGVAVLMPFYAWAHRGMRPLAGLFASLVLAGLVGWPLAWTPGVTGSQPWLWWCIGPAILCVAVARSTGWAVAYSGVVALVYFGVRLTPSGGSSEWLFAFADTLWVAVQPACALLLLGYLRAAVAELDESLERSHQGRVDAALHQALAVERSRLAAIVHDEVMTTLVAAAHADGERAGHVAAQASHALESLAAAAGGDQSAGHVGADELVTLVSEIVRSVCPSAEVTGTVADDAPVLPPEVVQAFTEAVREASLNAARHADADHVCVATSVESRGDRVTVRIEVTDDGRGFVPEEVTPGRLGIRVSLQERLRLVGGDARVNAEPGQGTVVSLVWEGGRSERLALDRESAPQFADDPHPLLALLDTRPFRWIGLGLFGLYTVVGASSALLAERPGWMIAAILVMGITGIVAAFTVHIRRYRASLNHALAVCAAATSVLAALSLPLPGELWPEHSAWYLGPVGLLLMLAMARGGEREAWTGAGIHAVATIVAGIALGREPIVGLVFAVVPAGWLALLKFLMHWLDLLRSHIAEAAASSRESAAQRAESYSKLVLREVWLADVRRQVGALLARLSDPDHVLDEQFRRECLLAEEGLRDAISSANLISPVVTEAILDARRRGLSVTLVDNRSSRLPKAVWRKTLAELENSLRSAAGGRIVARTAPAGYAEAATILHVAEDGTIRLTKIDHEGMATVSEA